MQVFRPEFTFDEAHTNEMLRARAKRLVKRRALPNVCNTVYIQCFAQERFADVQPKKGEFCSLHTPLPGSEGVMAKCGSYAS